jgi:hypothetical protein
VAFRWFRSFFWAGENAYHRRLTGAILEASNPRMKLVWIVVTALAAGALSAAPGGQTLTGWFACNKCTASRAAKGDMQPNNPVCARQCIEKGDDAVFLSEQGKVSLKVIGYAAAKEDLGYHLEVTGTVDTADKTIKVESVKRLSYEGASCSRPRTSQKK